MTANRVFRAVERLRRGFVDSPSPVADESLESVYSMLEDIFGAIEPPAHWYMPDKWADFRRKVNGGPSPIEAAFDARLKEDAAPMGKRSQVDWRGVHHPNDRYEVKN